MKLFSLAFILSNLLFYTGCSNVEHKPHKDKVTVIVSLVEPNEMVIPGAVGTSQTINGVCKVQILKSIYPDCLTHELMHCFEGNWHQGYRTSEYCNVR